MSGTKDLKDLLERLKGEVGPLPADRLSEDRFSEPGQPEPYGRPSASRPGPLPAGVRREGINRPYRLPEGRPESSDKLSGTAWAEIKETILFGMLGSLTAALGGVLAGFEYLVIAGISIFSLFSLVMAVAISRLVLNWQRPAQDSNGLVERVDALSKRVEVLSSRAVSGGVHTQPQSGGGGDRELEQKVEELRTMVKSLSKAIEGGNKQT
ncbi:MAG: hypothetical protein CVU79_02175 [Elusimicrobia bacterium HGW-Elusimicrobia-3]|jgi:hypothetical protein|nr:MAG: hypothetical protein CVU79_02175 [Elusimicrobia bacterium HGW-Elusimicrobia-3]